MRTPLHPPNPGGWLRPGGLPSVVLCLHLWSLSGCSLPQAALDCLLLDAALGKPSASQLRLQLLRLAASYVLECSEEGEAGLAGRPE